MKYMKKKPVCRILAGALAVLLFVSLHLPMSQGAAFVPEVAPALDVSLPDCTNHGVSDAGDCRDLGCQTCSCTRLAATASLSFFVFRSIIGLPPGLVLTLYLDWSFKPEPHPPRRSSHA